MKGGFLDATGTRARFHGPRGLTVDRDGIVVVVDRGQVGRRRQHACRQWGGRVC